MGPHWGQGRGLISGHLGLNFQAAYIYGTHVSENRKPCTFPGNDSKTRDISEKRDMRSAPGNG